MKYIAPKAYEKSFTCPHCGVLSKQDWNSRTEYFGNESQEKNIIRIGYCQHCCEFTLWLGDKMFFPETGVSPFPNPEMPESVKKLYLEAASISTKSPRGSSALLRLAIQILCKELGEEGKKHKYRH